MMDTTRTQQIEMALEGRRLLDHPFYVRWQAGELRDTELRTYAEQYRFFERQFPTFLTALSELLAPGPARDAVLANLHDETSAPSHLELFDDFANAVGADDAEITPAMAALLNAYTQVLDEGADVALAGLVAYELQGAAIAETKRDGLERHYGVSGDGLEFWTVHGSIEDDHACWTLDALDSIEAPEGAVNRGVSLVGNAWWDFLDERETMATL